MDKLYKPENIKRFSDCLVRAFENGEEQNIERLLIVLQMLVNGPPGERCQNFYNKKLPPDRCIAAALRAKSTRDALKADEVKCEQLINLLLGLPYLTAHLCRALSTLITCLRTSSDLARSAAARILRHEDLYKFDVQTIQRCLEEDSTELEMTMTNLCILDSSDDEYVKLFDHWIRWCCQSRDIFELVSWIWNELLKRLNFKRKVLDAIAKFVGKIRANCCVNQIDLVTLYPYEVQNLVCLLEMDSDVVKNEGSDAFEMILQTIRTEFIRIRQSDPNMALLLTTHFPQWNEHLV